jgi:gamma-glutamylcyclotransferase (GGCT)/AIG2-like uncharacterized protein YtfP
VGLTHRLFVYGTLMAGQSAAGVLGTLRRRPALVKGALWDLPAGYPALVLGGEANIEGELVEGVTDAHFVMLDLFEGVDEGLYRRVEVMCEHNGKNTPAFAYVMDDPASRGGRPWRGGRWRAVRNRR